MGEISVDLNAVKHENRLELVKQTSVYLPFLGLICIPIAKCLGGQYLILFAWMLVQFYCVWNANGTFRYLMQVFLSFCILILLSFLAAKYFVFTILLNLAVPFWLVLMTANEYDKMSYFGYIYTYGYLEIFFREFGSLKESLIAFVYMAGCFALMFLVCSLLRMRKRQLGTAIPGGLKAAANAFSSDDPQSLEKAIKTAGETGRQISLNIYDRNMHAQIGGGRVRRVPNSEEDAVSKMLSAFIPVFTLIEKLLLMKKKAAPGGAEIFKSTGRFLAIAYACFYTHERDAAAAVTDFLQKTDWSDADETKRTVKQLLMLLGADMAQLADFKEEKAVQANHLFRNIFQSISFDDFRYRLAIRMSAALTIAYVLTWLTPSIKSYWIAFNTFLLMMPVYEDVKRKIPKRFVATLIGIAFAFFCFNFLHVAALTEPIVLTALFVSILASNYLLKAACGTILATLPATAVAGGNFAFVLRLIFLGVAVLIVLFVNRFVLKTNNRRELKRHFQTLLSLDRALIQYLQAGKSNYFGIKLMLIRSVLVFASIQEYTEQEEGENENQLLQFIEANKSWQFAIASWMITKEGIEQLNGLDQILAKGNNGGKPLYEDGVFLKSAGEAMMRLTG